MAKRMHIMSMEPQPTRLIIIDPRKKKLCLLCDSNSWSIVAFHDLSTTSAVTSRLAKRLRSTRGTSMSYSGKEVFTPIFSPTAHLTDTGLMR